MQLEIRNAVEHDQIVYSGVGVLFGAGIAIVFFRRVSLMLLAALPPVLAVTWSLGLLGWLGVRLNLFLNVMTPLVMVMGFADSMQMVAAIRIRLREGDSRREALAFAVRVVGPACVLAHAAAGDVAGALKAAEEAAREWEEGVTFFYDDPDLGPILRSEPFAEFRKKYPPPKEEEKKRY